MYDIARGITNARMRRGISQREAAERSGYSIRSIQQWEKGEHVMNFQAAIDLAVVYDVTLEEMAGMQRKMLR